VSPPPPARVPRATYRLQLGPDLTFDGVAGLLPYLEALGISDVYLSPLFETASGASHGYDVCDHNRLRDELGGEAALARLAAALRARGLGCLLDVVPNHMGIGQNRNAWWLDVLENGESSPYAPFFDIDWTPIKAELQHKVLLPILGDHYGTVLESGQFRLALEDGRLRIHYHDTVLPVAPRTYSRVLGLRLEELAETLGPEHEAVLRLKSVIARFSNLPPSTEPDPARLAARHREREIARQELLDLLRDSPDVRRFLDDNVVRVNGTPGEPRSFDLMDGLLGDQRYRVAFWRVAAEEINYRRFFDINELAAIRMEDPRVFAETHRLVGRLVRDGIVTGLRIDHPDGLYEPAAYFRRLQRMCFLERAHAAAAAAGATPADADLLRAYDEAAAAGEAPLRPFYVVAEKILAPGERLPETWAVHGTTGYEFLNLLNGIFVDRQQARQMDQLYARWVRGHPSFAEIVYASKRLIMETSMASELSVLGHRLDVISERHRSSRDFTLGSLTHALREIVASFPVYRTYLGESGGRAAEERDREYVARAIALAKSRTPARDLLVYDWIQDLLLLRFPDWADDAVRADRRDWVMRFQQTTGPVTAKGYEDTALYRYHRLVSLNEVGNDPARFGTPLAEFHAACAARLRETPHALSATSTHDTKRSEDVRARIDVLSEIPAEWRRRLVRWHRLNRRHRTNVDGRLVPGPNEETLVYQTLVGAWPITAERLRAYVLKATREAKVYTSWITPHERYDAAMAAFVEAIVDPGRAPAFLADFGVFQSWVAVFGAVNGLAQTLVKATAPGVPDFYQGTELWDLSLVDPDNRRPVDWERRRQALEALTAEMAATPDLAALAEDLLKSRDDGRVKLYVTRQALHFRREHADLFATGDYRPLETRGPLAEHLCAFARVSGTAAALTVVPRLLARLGLEDAPLGPAAWQETRLVLGDDLAGAYRNVLTGERVDAQPGADGPALAAGEVLARFPVALLERAA
jgi:(1->4)-alpha-D-glucan 1-alpha-D-glucosylmutase